MLDRTRPILYTVLKNEAQFPAPERNLYKRKMGG
jgi:hypothetical protein